MRHDRIAPAARTSRTWLRAAALLLALLPGFTSAATLAWIPNASSNDLSVLDTANNSVSGPPVALSATPVGVAVAASKVYVTHDSGDLAVIDKTTRNVTTPLNFGIGTLGVTLNRDGTRLYVSNSSNGHVHVVDTATNTLITSIAVSEPRGLALSPDDSRLYVASNGSGVNPQLLSIDTATNTLRPNGEQVGVRLSPYGVAVSPDGTRVYVTGQTNGVVSVVDAVNHVKLTDITVGSQPRGIAVNSAGTRVYVALSGTSFQALAVVNATTNTFIHAVNVGSNPWGLDVSGDGSRVYVANTSSGTLSVVNTANDADSVVATVFVGSQPSAFGRFLDATPPPPPTPPVLGDVPDQNGTVGTAFSLSLAGYVTPTNGDPILSYAIAAGALPAGLSLDTASGAISGTPQLAGNGYSISVTASDKDGASNADTITFSIAMPGSVPPQDILVGSYTGSVRGFVPGANGNAAPYRVLAGTTTALQYPYSLTYEPKEDVLYVGDFYGQAVRVFPVGANGDATPRRVLDSPFVGQAHVVAVDTLHDELVVAGSGCILCTWPRTASGSDLFTRRIYWGGNSGTQLNNPFGLALDPENDLIYVGDTDFSSSPTPYAGKVLVFPRTANGDVAPSRIIKGPATRIGSGTAVYIALDPDMQLLYVLTSSIDAVNSSLRHARILVFSAAADGDVAPLRAIEGAATQLDIPSDQYPYALSLDPASQRLLVSIYSNTATSNRVLAFFAGDSGDVAPLLSLGGANTGFDKIGGAVAVPDRILRNGFEVP